MENSNQVQRLAFTHGFERIQFELGKIDAKIDIQEGWIFKSHKYSIDDLLQSDHFDKIDSIIRKIEDDVINWAKSGQLTREAERFYNDSRKRVLDEINLIQEKIRNRKPTWWENFSNIMNEFTRHVLEHLPIIRACIIRLPEFIRKMIPASVGKFIDKLSNLLGFEKRKKFALEYDSPNKK